MELIFFSLISLFLASSIYFGICSLAYKTKENVTRTRPALPPGSFNLVGQSLVKPFNFWLQTKREQWKSLSQREQANTPQKYSKLLFLVRISSYFLALRQIVSSFQMMASCSYVGGLPQFKSSSPPRHLCPLNMMLPRAGSSYPCFSSSMRLTNLWHQLTPFQEPTLRITGRQRSS
jgi:hypothetical protein